MNIPIQKVKEEIEKTGGVTSKVFKYIAKHPWQVIVPTAAIGTSLYIANKVHPLHQMVREETKRKAMTGQHNTLKEMLNEMKKASNKPPPKTEPKIIIPPLA